uniref:hypothetical protein n=1 Tax=Candidatus Electronema sp. TaxID=2698783 RepID=UPI0040564EBE
MHWQRDSPEFSGRFRCFLIHCSGAPCFHSWIQVPSAIFWQVPKNSFFGVLKPRDFRGLLLIFSAMQLMSC